MNPPPDAEIPLSARVHLSHAVVETIALDAGVDLLHIKGPALLPDLRAQDRGSTDVDVLVAPGHLALFERALARHGWERRSDYASGSAFRHAANWFHDNWGYVDVHARWPGPRVGAEEVFAAFAAGEHRQDIAHVPCRVPNRIAQILILVLHAARSHGYQRRHRARLEPHLAGGSRRRSRPGGPLQARTAFAAGIGELDSVVGDPTAELWRYYSQEGGSRLGEWRARWRAAATLRERRDVVVSALVVNRDHLRMELGHVPSRREVAARQWQRVRVLSREVGGALRRSRPQRGPMSGPGETGSVSLGDRVAWLDPLGRARAGRGLRQHPARRSAGGAARDGGPDLPGGRQGRDARRGRRGRRRGVGPTGGGDPGRRGPLRRRAGPPRPPHPH